jgi:hypothetical protein
VSAEDISGAGGLLTTSLGCRLLPMRYAGAVLMGRGTLIGRVLPFLVSVALSASALSASSPALAASASATRSCGRFMVDGWPVSKLRVTNVRCAQARRMLVHYHNTGHGLTCFTFSDDAPVHIRCKARVAAARSRRSGPASAGSSPQFVEAVIDFSLPDCAAAGDCGA